MSKPIEEKKSTKPSKKSVEATGTGGELHQVPARDGPTLTTNQGVTIADNQNSLKANARGPTLVEDFILREKITHFDHERIPERIVHARGSGAHGFFEVYESLADYTKADFLQRPGERTEVFVRISTVAGGAGSADLARDVRGFAVKFYTQEGNFDLVGNNIPVFFIQDAIKFPDLIHAAKMEPDRGFPQAATAHDNFWDFISLMPESMHMVMWAMSDRTIPRSLRMIEGFGIHTFRLVNQKGASTFVKFHWRPKLGMQSVLWDEAVKINGADPDFHRRDLWEAINTDNFPEWELGLQVFDQAQADSFDFDVLDATKLIPEEILPLKIVGRLVLDRNPDNFFAETEQVAFCPAHIVPGIDFSNDPLLQGRLASYIDTQLSRLGGPNFHEIPINRPRCPMQNFQRDGHMRMTVPTGRVNYEPNTLAPQGPRAEPLGGLTTFPRHESGDVLRIRPESFADHYSQARLFYISQTEPEQDHIAAALVFELSKVETPAIRARVVSHLMRIDASLAKRVHQGLGLSGAIEPAATSVVVKDDLPASPALSILGKAVATLKGRTIGCLVGDGFDPALLEGLGKALAKEGAAMKIIATHIADTRAAGDDVVAADFTIDGGPSIFFDAVLVAAAEEGARKLSLKPAAVNFVRDAFCHLKVIGHIPATAGLMQEAGIEPGGSMDGIIAVSDAKSLSEFVAAAKMGRVWQRQSLLSPPSLR